LRNNRIPQGYGFGRFGFPAGQQLSHAVCTMISFDSRSNGEPVHECPREKKFVTPDLIAVAPGLSDGVARGRRYRPNVGRGLSGGGSGRDRLLAGGVRKRPWPTSFSDVRRTSDGPIDWMVSRSTNICQLRACPFFQGRRSPSRIEGEGWSAGSAHCRSRVNETSGPRLQNAGSAPLQGHAAPIPALRAAISGWGHASGTG